MSVELSPGARAIINELPEDARPKEPLTAEQVEHLNRQAEQLAQIRGPLNSWYAGQVNGHPPTDEERARQWIDSDAARRWRKEHPSPELGGQE